MADRAFKQTLNSQLYLPRRFIYLELERCKVWSQAIVQSLLKLPTAGFPKMAIPACKKNTRVCVCVSQCQTTVVMNEGPRMQAASCWGSHISRCLAEAQQEPDSTALSCFGGGVTISHDSQRKGNASSGRVGSREGEAIFAVFRPSRSLQRSSLCRAHVAYLLVYAA